MAKQGPSFADVSIRSAAPLALAASCPSPLAPRPSPQVAAAPAPWHLAGGRKEAAGGKGRRGGARVAGWLAGWLAGALPCRGWGVHKGHGRTRGAGAGAC